MRGWLDLLDFANLMNSPPPPSFFAFFFYLADVDAIVDRPGCLEALHHALLECLGQPVHPDEVLQVLGAGVVEGAAGVHPLDDGGHVAEDNGVHQGCRGDGGRIKVECIWFSNKVALVVS